MKTDNILQHYVKVKGDREAEINRLKAQMEDKAIPYKAQESDFNRVRLPPTITALDDVPPELERLAALDLKWNEKLSIPNLASVLFSMDVPSHAHEWHVLQNSMCTQIKLMMKKAFKEWNGAAKTWPK